MSLVVTARKRRGKEATLILRINMYVLSLRLLLLIQFGFAKFVCPFLPQVSSLLFLFLSMTRPVKQMKRMFGIFFT